MLFRHWNKSLNVQIDNDLLWGIKTKAVQADLCLFTHILTYSGIFRLIQELFRHTQPCIIPAYLEFCHIQSLGIFWTRYIYIYIYNPGIFRTLAYAYSELEVYSEPCQTSKIEQLFSNYSCLVISAFHVLYSF